MLKRRSTLFNLLSAHNAPLKLSVEALHKKIREEGIVLSDQVLKG